MANGTPQSYEVLLFYTNIPPPPIFVHFLFPFYRERPPYGTRWVPPAYGPLVPPARGVAYHSILAYPVRMTLELVPELGVPIPPDVPYADLRQRLDAVCNSLEALGSPALHAPVPPSAADAAAQLARDYAADPEAASRQMTPRRLAKATPATLLLAKQMLDDFGQRVVEDAVQIRNLVTNRLLEEASNPDARVRLKALELLGKISDVGLFAEKSEVTITHQTTDDIKERLRAKLARLVNVDDAVIVDGEPVDVAAELGLAPQSDEEPDRC